MIRYIDTHTHLYDEAFDIDSDEVVEKIKKTGVIKCVLPGIDKSTYERQLKFAEKNEGFAFQAMGLHPTSVNAGWEEECEFVRNELSTAKNKYYAVGEIGLDGYWSKDFMKEQMLAFKKQIIWAYELNLPIIVHAREATEQIFEVLEETISELGLNKLTCNSNDTNEGHSAEQKQPYKRVLRGVFHAFSGSYETFCRLNRYGDFKVGIGGVVTYKNSGLSETLKRIPLDSVLLETDSPWLTPVPNRGKRNDSSNIVYIAERIAGIKGVILDEVAETTAANAESLFMI